jgi:hypothetical protein
MYRVLKAPKSPGVFNVMLPPAMPPWTVTRLTFRLDAPLIDGSGDERAAQVPARRLDEVGHDHGGVAAARDVVAIHERPAEPGAKSAECEKARERHCAPQERSAYPAR